MDNKNILTFIGLMRRASALSIGAESAYDACRMGKARLLALARDAAPNTVKSAAFALQECKARRLDLPFTKGEIGAALGVKECAVFAVCDTGFAHSLCEKLGEQEGEQALKLRVERERRRKRKKQARGERPAKQSTEKRGSCL